MDSFLICTVYQGGAMGAILEFVVLEGVMERLFLWSLRRQFTEDMKLEQLRMYQMLLSQAKQPLLHHKPILRPLMMLLASCTGPGTGQSSLFNTLKNALLFFWTFLKPQIFPKHFYFHVNKRDLSDLKSSYCDCGFFSLISLESNHIPVMQFV